MSQESGMGPRTNPMTRGWDWGPSNLRNFREGYGSLGRMSWGGSGWWWFIFHDLVDHCHPRKKSLGGGFKYFFLHPETRGKNQF